MTEAPVIREVWIDGRQHVLGEFEPPEVEPAGKWDLVMKTGEMGDIEAELKLSGKAPVLSGEFVVMGMPVPLAEARVSGKRLKVRIDGAGLGMPGNINFSPSGSAPQRSLRMMLRPPMALAEPCITCMVVSPPAIWRQIWMVSASLASARRTRAVACRVAWLTPPSTAACEWGSFSPGGMGRPD